jgi:hypothetical protein
LDETEADRRALSGFAAVLDGLEVRLCGLAHEGWRGRPGTSLFCDRMSRAANIACAHTTARYVLREAISALRARGHPQADAWLAEWQALDGEIGRCDHARSEAEKLADADSVAAAVARHGAAARALAALHVRIRAALLSSDVRSSPAGAS